MEFLALLSFFSVKILALSITIAFVIRRLVSDNRPEKSLGKVVPCLRGLPLLGNAHQLIKTNSKAATMNVYLMQAWIGLSQIFKKEKIFQYSLGNKRYYGLCNADHVEAILKSTVHVNKSADYDSFIPWLGNGLLTNSGLKWKVRRKLLTPTFHFKVLDNYQPIIEDKCQKVVEKLRKHPTPDKCRLSSVIELALMDSICETAMGYRVNALEEDNCEFLHHLHVLCDGLVKRAFTPWYAPDIIWNNSTDGKKFNESNRYVQEFVKKVITDRKAELRGSANLELGERPAFLDLLMREHFRDPSFTEEDLRDEINTFMFAGQDTTLSGISWSLFMIGHNPEVQEQIAEELYSVFGDEVDSTITHEHLKELKYLECTIKEAQRMQPSVPIFLRKIEEDFWLDSEYMIPKGYIAAIFTKVLSTSEDYFPEADKCKPERFFVENSSGRHPFAYIPFSAGPRNCVGQRFAMLELKTMLANILRNFQVTSLDPIDQITVELQTVSKPSRDLAFCLKKRNFAI